MKFLLANQFSISKMNQRLPSSGDPFPPEPNLRQLLQPIAPFSGISAPVELNFFNPSHHVDTSSLISVLGHRV
jgi:hypothetical protein